MLRVPPALALSAGLTVLGLIAATHPGHAQTYEAKDCEQNDTAWLALRACSMLLDSNKFAGVDRARFHAWRGFAWLKEDDFDEAMKDFNHAVELDGRNVKAFTGRAKAHTLSGNHKAAAQDWTAVIENSTGSGAVEAYLLLRGASWLAAGNADAALADYSKVLDTNPKSADAYIGRANVYATLKDREKALRDFDTAERIDPKNFAPYLARAEAAEQWGDVKLAIENYSAALRLKTTVWAARKSLKRLGIDTPP